ncbi:MAG: hypothetical protein OEY18_02745 [Candidatus Aminicenantes bacterium]|nr:hypothetical protein [Candidatus Aminicenantes bacterium]MDH5383602.1 hypothetical protein [Candidatus Aminicenantes bacterium]MDH5743733.1 hypothetical protein [Candidatus Aminicenantes bacterium]
MDFSISSLFITGETWLQDHYVGGVLDIRNAVSAECEPADVVRL